MGKCLALVLMSGCCWVFQEKLPSDYAGGHHEPPCSASPGAQIADGIFAALNASTIVYEIANPARADLDNYTLATSIGFTLLHLLSLHSGHTWSGECQEAIDDYQAAEQAPSPMPSERGEAVRLPPPPTPAPDRKIVHGEKPMFCAISTTDSEDGACYLDSATCREAQAASPDALNECVQRSAAACFNADRVLDDKRMTFCAATVKSCEARRGRREDDIDYSNVAKQCGVYRADAHDEEESSP